MLRLACPRCIGLVQQRSQLKSSATGWLSKASLATGLPSGGNHQGRASKKPARKRADNIPASVLYGLRQDILLQEKYQYNVYKKSLTFLWKQDPLTSNFIATSASAAEVIQCLPELDPPEIINALKELADNNLLRYHGKSVHACQQYIGSHMRLFTLDQLLYITDLFHVCGLPVDTFCRRLFLHVTEFWDVCQVRGHHAVQLLYLVSVLRNAPVVLFQLLEELLIQEHPHLSGRELGLICNGFYTGNRSLRSVALLQGLWQALLRDVNNLPLVMVANFLKVFKHADFGLLRHYWTLAESLCMRTDLAQANPSHISAITSAYAAARVRHEQLFKLLSPALLSSKHEKFLRVKDLARFVYACAILQIKPSDELLTRLIAQLKRDDVAMKYFPEVIVEGLLALTVVGRYPEDVISTALSPKLVNQKAGRILEQRMQHIFLDSAVGIELPEYQGHRLAEAQAQAAWQVEEEAAQENIRGIHIHRHQEFACIWLSLIDIGGDYTCVKCHFVLPFSKLPDLEIRLDANSKLMPFRTDVTGIEVDRNTLEQCKRQLESVHGDVKQAAAQSVLASVIAEKSDSLDLSIQHLPALRKIFPETRVCLKVCGWNQYLLNAPLLLGLHQKEVGLLQQSGYHVVVIPPNLLLSIEGMPPQELRQFVQETILSFFSSSSD